MSGHPQAGCILDFPDATRWAQKMTRIEEFLKSGRPFYVSITGLKPRGLWSYILFLRHAIPSKVQADRAPGLLWSGVRRIDGIEHTLTAWESREAMRTYISSGAHLKAMKVFRRIATGKTLGYETRELPSWEDVPKIWRDKGREY